MPYTIKSIGALVLFSVTAAHAQSVPPGIAYYNYPPGNAITGSEVIGPIRQNGKNVTTSPSALNTYFAAQFQGAFQTPTGVADSNTVLNRTLAAIAADRINIKSYGAVGNARRTAVPVTLAVGSQTLTASVTFTPADVGKVAVVAGAGAAGAALVTAITGYVSANTVTLAAAGATLPPTATAAGNYTFMWGTDDTAAMQAAVSAENAAMAAGQFPCLYAPGGSYLLSAPPGSFSQGLPGCIEGDGPVHTAFWLSPVFAGNVFDWSEAWVPTISGPQARNLRIDGWLGAPAQQNGLVFYDRNDNLSLENIDVWTMPGRGFYAGVEKNVNQAYLRESHNLTHLRFFSDGAPGVPAVEFTSQNTSGAGSESTNAILVTGLRIYGSNGPSLVIRNANTTKAVNSLVFNEISVEGTENGTTAADLITIGDPVMAGQVFGVTMTALGAGDPYTGYATLRLTAPSGATAPYFVTVDGSIGGGLPNGKGLVIDAGRDSRFHFSNIATNGTNVTMGAVANVTGNIRLDVDGHEPTLTYSVDPTTVGYLFTPLMRQGLPTASPAIVGNNHDGSNTGGELTGLGAVDLQQTRYFYTQTATAANSTIGGGSNNTAAAGLATIGGGNSNANVGYVGFIGGGSINTIATGSFGAILGGQGNYISGTGTGVPGGQFAADRGRYNWQGWASGKIAVLGDAQTGAQLFHGMTNVGVGLRLTADFGSAGVANVANMPVSSHYHTRVSASCRDNTAAGWASWDALPGDLDRGTGTTVTYAGGYSSVTAPSRSAGTLASMTLVLASDSTNEGLSVAVNPPSGNADVIHCVSRVDTTEEVQ